MYADGVILWERLRDFLEAGGVVLTVIFAVTLLLWTMIAERYLFLRIAYPKLWRQTVSTWRARKDHSSWWAQQVRRKLIAETRQHLGARVGAIQAIVAVCPLLGLLGTVNGMIAIFETMSVMGTSNPRTMASGISLATIPTMAGMVASLSGLFFASQLQKRVRSEAERLADNLPLV